MAVLAVPAQDCILSEATAGYKVPLLLLLAELAALHFGAAEVVAAVPAMPMAVLERHMVLAAGASLLYQMLVQVLKV